MELTFGWLGPAVDAPPYRMGGPLIGAVDRPVSLPFCSAAWRAWADWSRLRVDLSLHIPIAGWYEVELRKTGGTGELEIESAMPILEGEKTHGFATRQDRPIAPNDNRTAAPTGRKESTALRLDLRDLMPPNNYRTTVRCECRDGQVRSLSVTPNERQEDVIIPEALK